MSAHPGYVHLLDSMAGNFLYSTGSRAVKRQVHKPDHPSIAHTPNTLILVVEARGSKAAAEKYRQEARAFTSPAPAK